MSLDWKCAHVGILRVHAHPGGVVGQPYKWCLVVIRDGDRAILEGAWRLATTREERRADRLAIERRLTAEGFRVAGKAKRGRLIFIRPRNP